MVKSKLNKLFAIFGLCTVVVIMLSVGCKKQTPHVKIPDHYEPVTIARFEKDLFGIDTNAVENGLINLHQKYGTFYLSFARDLMDMKNRDGSDSFFIKPLSMLCKYTPFRDLQKQVDSSFGDMHDISDQLGLANAIYKQEFPKRVTPKYVTFISEYSYANVTYDNLICIGLDMFMNDKFAHYYRALEFPEFMIRKLCKDYVVPNTIKALGISQFEDQNSKDKRFIATMIFEGKVRYFMQSLLPNTPDSIILGYTTSQMDWCLKNEGEMWAHFIEKDLLYKDDQQSFMKYFNDGPFTSADGVPAESSPAIGVYAGLQIVKKYMHENPKLTLEELMNEKDFDKILKQSKYRP